MNNTPTIEIYEHPNGWLAPIGNGTVSWTHGIRIENTGCCEVLACAACAPAGSETIETWAQIAAIMEAAPGLMEHILTGAPAELRCYHCATPIILAGDCVPPTQADLWLHGIRDPEWAPIATRRNGPSRADLRAERRHQERVERKAAKRAKRQQARYA